MTTNASPQFNKAEKKFLNAKDNQEKLIFLDEMIREAPKHKSSENLLANLKTRRKKLREELERTKKISKGKSSKAGIKKLEMQAVIVGKAKSGKSSLLSVLTNAKPKIAIPEAKFTTTKPIIGMMDFNSASIQLIETPAIDSEFYDKGLVHNADGVLILITNLNELKEIEEKIKTSGKKLIIFNKSDLLSETEKRKLEATLKSKYKNYDFVIISCETRENLPELKEKIFKSFNKIRVYTKEPGKQKSQNPIILEPETTVKEVAEKILKGFSEKVKETKIWGPSSKFPGQIVGLKHKLKDLDIVEFKTR